MTNPAISIQLFTVRDELTADLDGTLAELSAIGFTTVEPYDFVRRADALAAAFARARHLVPHRARIPRLGHREPVRLRRSRSRPPTRSSPPRRRSA